MAAARYDVAPSDREILRAWVQHHDRAGALLGMELPLVRQRHADPRVIEQSDQGKTRNGRLEADHYWVMLSVVDPASPGQAPTDYA